MRPKRGRGTRYYISGVLGLVAVLAMSPVVVPLVLGQLTYRGLRGLRLRRLFRETWGAQGKLGVFVYSDSPHWKEHIEAAVLPRLGGRFVTLNWSRRSEWKEHCPLEAQVFQQWAGAREFNPIAIIVPPRGAVRTFRFWKAYQASKHGNAQELQRQEADLFAAVDAAQQALAAGKVRVG